MHYMGNRHRLDDSSPCHCVVVIRSEISFVTNTMILNVETQSREVMRLVFSIIYCKSLHALVKGDILQSTAFLT